MQKSGKVTLQPSRVPQKKKLTMSDFFTTFVEANWCLVIGMYLVVFIFSWAFFGTVWFAIFWLRFRFDSGVTCVDNVDSWTSAFLLSVETQTTIGYGGRQVWRSCSSPSSFLHFHANWSRRKANTRGETYPRGAAPPLPRPSRVLTISVVYEHKVYVAVYAQILQSEKEETIKKKYIKTTTTTTNIISCHDLDKWNENFK